MRLTVQVWAAIIFFAASVAMGKTEAAALSQGSLENMVDFILHNFDETGFRVRKFIFINENRRLSITLNVFRTRPGDIDERSNRCSVDTNTSTITCDTSLIDYLLAEFNVGRIETARKSLLRWIIAHEIGHIALNHSPSDYSDPLEGYLVFAPQQQRLELAADDFAIKVVGDLARGPKEDYGLLLAIVNELIRKNLCPESYPSPCARIAPGVGIVYNSADETPIKISVGGLHPEFVARFLRLIYLAGLNTKHHSINYLAGQVIQKLVVQVPGKGWVSLKEAFAEL